MATPANRGRKAMPRGMRVLNGGTSKDGQPIDSAGRAIEDEVPFTREPPQRPEHLTDDAAWLWDRIVEEMSTVQVLKPLDGPALEVVCETFARWRGAVRMRLENGTLAENSQGRVTAPWVGIEERAAKDFRAWCAEFGITPAAERNLRSESGVPDDRTNPF